MACANDVVDRIRIISSDVISSIVGTGNSYTGDAAATAFGLPDPTGIAIDAGNSDIYIGSSGMVQIFVYTKSTGIVTTFAGNDVGGVTEGYATAVTIDFPEGLFLDTNSQLYFSDYYQCTVRVVTPNMPTVSPTQAPSISPTYHSTENPTALPSTLVPSPAPTTPAPSTVRNSINYIYTVVGTGSDVSSGTGGLAVFAGSSEPVGVWQDTSGVLYFSEYGASCVRKFSVSDNIVHAFAGVCQSTDEIESGVVATSTYLDSPYGVMGDTLGNVYIADSGHSRVHVVDATGILSFFAGKGNTEGSGGEVATTASLPYPTWLWLNTNGQVYVYSSYKIQTVVNGKISTFLGTGSVGGDDDTGVASSAMLSSFGGITGDTANNIYYTDNSKYFICFIHLNLIQFLR